MYISNVSLIISVVIVHRLTRTCLPL
jgi:hypothetical protein